MSINTIFIVHKGNSFYLKYCLNQLHFYNKGIDIVLLGDEANNKYPFVKHYNIEEYSGRSIQFKNYYKHRSTNIYSYELFCFERWFVLEEFVAKNNIQGSFIYFDSDVLVYCNVNEMLRWIDDGKRMSVCKTKGPQYSFFADYTMLNEYCDFMLNTQKDESICQEWDQMYARRIKGGLTGGVCDMTVLNMFYSEHIEFIAELHGIKDNIVIDHNINQSDFFEMSKKRTKVVWKNGLPYAIKSENGDLVRFLAIHFQGKAKRVMHRHYTGPRLGMSQMMDAILLSRFR